MKPILLLLALVSGIYTHATGTPRHNQFAISPDSVARSYAIDNVLVSGKIKTIRLGRDVRHSMLKASLNHETGAECGVRCRINKGSVRLGMMRIYCHTIQIDSLTFALHLYDMQGDSIGQRLPSVPILIPICPKDNLTEFDLTAYDLRMSHDFLLALDIYYIKKQEIDPKRQFWTGIFFNTRLGARTYYRYQQDTAWQSSRFGFGLSIEATPAPLNSEL